MKKFAMSLMLLLSFSALAQTVQEAEGLYDKREADPSFAMQAGQMYEVLAGQATEKLEKAKLLNAASNAYYYVGTQKETNKEKMVVFQKGLNIAVKAIDEVRTSTANEELEQKALGMYRYGANLGKWGEANGVAASLGKWKNLRNNMLGVISMGYKSLEDYGANRILGRAYYKLPAPLGSKKKSYSYLSEAFKNTKAEGSTVSRNGLNNLFLVDLLISVGKKESAKKILNAFIAYEGREEELNSARIPETKAEIAEAKEILKNL